MLYRTLILFTAVLSLHCEALCQAGGLRADMDVILNDLNRIRARNAWYLQADGTPYFAEDWIKGNIIFNANVTYKDIELNVDLYAKEVHYKHDGRELVVESKAIKEIQVYVENENGRMVQLRSGFELDSKRSLEFFEVLGEGRLGLVRRLKKVLKEATEFGDKAEFKDETTLYFLSNNKLTRAKKDELLDLFPNKKAEIQHFIKTNKLKFSDERHLTILMNYCNGF